ncbi:anti-sigma factor family protein [Motiliproteus sediminis]|uniref:anti-sigma factor family protein n=1 Tax=Motiliproteus sediminis TaxID=1468178 RepID=UPI001AF02707|nr:hypothetical protein [Motiliproteus sediminis]
MSEQRMEEMLAWYVNGTLDAAERQQVEAWLADNPEAQMQLAEYEFMRDSVAETGSEESAFDTEAGLDALMARIDQDEAANQPQLDASGGSLWQRFRQSLQWNLTPAFARVAMVSQLGVVMVLGALLMLPAETEEPGYQVLSGPPAVVAGGVVLTLGLAPDTRADALQALLRSQQAEIIAGPSALGTYRIRLPDDDQQAARTAALKAHPAVTYLEPAQ